MTLTSRQRDVLNFIARFIAERQYPPTYREIMRKFDYASTNGVSRHLDALQRKGAIEIDHKVSRGIRVVENGWLILLQGGNP